MRAIRNMLLIEDEPLDIDDLAPDFMDDWAALLHYDNRLAAKAKADREKIANRGTR